ncbi:Calcium binding EGF domain-containing protein [Aphelenchoides besseyi]|nr:Calcium binding EGF domain-containing protein [Aphelenchoides besseyi]
MRLFGRSMIQFMYSHRPVGLFLLLRLLIYLLPLAEATTRPCASSICFNGGSCVVNQRDGSEVAEFDCKCLPGFGGTLCEQVLACPLECKNGGTCLFDSNSNRPMCECKGEYNGPLCEDRNNCQQSGCPQGQTCLFDMTAKEFQCQKDHCTPNPCENNSTCRPITNDFVCECPRGVSGPTCAEDIDECTQESVVCLHNGTCINTFGGFHCKCVNGYSGKICEERRGFCVQKPCLNNGKCTETDDNYHCECPLGYNGQNCEIKLATLKCESPRVLTELHGVHQCLCPSGTFGDNCVMKPENECLVDGRECLNGGKCTEDDNKQPICRCAPSFSGRWCDKFVSKLTTASLIETTTMPETNDPCDPSPCNAGTCIAEDDHPTCTCPNDRFVGDKCERCVAPFLLPDCVNELQEVTFGHNNLSSSVELAVEPSNAQPLISQTHLSFRLRTNKPDGQLLQIGQTGDENTNTYISCALKNGVVELETRLAGWKVARARGVRRVDDNQPHYVDIQRQGNRINLTVDQMPDGELIIESPFTHPLFVDRLVLGNHDLNTSDSQLFKGTLQDVRVNDMPVLMELSPPDFLKQPTFGNHLSDQNTMSGTVSDDVCAKLEPCKHGKCVNTFNEYECKCEKGWFGSNCNLVDHCSQSPCPQSSNCENVFGGYVCKSPATFTPTTSTKFLLKSIDSNESKLPIDNNSIRFSFALRTRSVTAHVFNLSTPMESFWMQLNDSVVVFKHANETTVTDDPLSFNLTNGQWHTVEIWLNPPSDLIVSFDNSSTVPLLSRFSLSEFLRGNDSWLTFGRSTSSSGFKGCIHNIRFTGLPELSFFDTKLSGVKSLQNVSRFEAQLLENVRPDGCHSRDLCAKNPCKNGALCKDLFNLRHCDCTSDFYGNLCEYKKDHETLINQCSNVSCSSHGKCRNVWQGHVCDCDSNWSGANCSIHENECEEFPCINAGQCINKDDSHHCVCPRGFNGDSCEKEIDFCEKRPCQNEGTCIRNSTNIEGFTCDCAVGFEGPHCEVNIDDCAPNPCHHNGRCMDRVAGFECDCGGTGYKGLLCDADQDECLEPNLNCVHGECTNLPGSYQCDCEPGFIGQRCNQVDPCYPDAQNRSIHSCVHGICVNARVVKSRDREIIEHDCSCFENFEGPQCSYVAQGQKPLDIRYVLGPAAALLVVSILLGCMLFFFVARSRRANQGTYSPSNQEMNGARVQMQTLQKPLKKQERLI